LGETNFELKSLVLFGVGLTALSTVTVILYWRLTSNLIDTTIRREARLLAADKLLERHWQRTESVAEFVPMIEKMAKQMRPDDLQGYESEFLSPDPTGSEGALRPGDQFGYAALEELRQGAKESIYIDREEGKYHYFSPMVASESCISCHYHKAGTVVDGKLVTPKPGDLLGVVKITLPLERNEEALHYANAFVITLEFVKVVLAILAIYLVVRYVITKPVLHLKKVSDAIARGNLDMRADIRTGDEFEELSHAFNRMLRHLVTVQEELRDVNADLDGKVDELAQVNLRLYELNKIKDEFLATMSHELRTPLNSILGFSEVLEAAQNLDERQKRFLANIQKSGRELMVLINDILDLAKIESGKMEVHAVDFEPAEVVGRQVEALAPLAEQKNIRLTCELAGDVDSIHQDPGKLQQIINNLLSNAIKFTPEGGRIRVATQAIENDRFELVVEDTGIGIPLEDQATVFEKFRQGKSIPGQSDALTREYEGTGLGLSIVRELSTLLGGDVLLESEFGKGSTFRVRLPRRLDETTRRRDPLLEAHSLAQSPVFQPRRRDVTESEDGGAAEEKAVSPETADDPADSLAGS
jgi:signal transduction histidine kinase